MSIVQNRWRHRIVQDMSKYDRLHDWKLFPYLNVYYYYYQLLLPIDQLVDAWMVFLVIRQFPLQLRVFVGRIGFVARVVGDGLVQIRFASFLQWLADFDECVLGCKANTQIFDLYYL